MDLLRKVALGAVVLLTLAIACGGPSIGDGAIVCGEDQSCPEGYVCSPDGHCYRSVGFCGDGIVDPGELCDPPGACPDLCGDGDACTKDFLQGEPEMCHSECLATSIENCNLETEDGCCPANCDSTSDADCGGTCGNGIPEAGELCDGDCPTDCPPDEFACTKDILMNGGTCRARCTHSELVTDCVGGDGCCPAGCAHDGDADCPEPEKCGNGDSDPGETCGEPNLPPCTPCGDRVLAECKRWDGQSSGSAGTCNLYCNIVDVTECITGDGCCPKFCGSIYETELDSGRLDTLGNSNDSGYILPDLDCGLNNNNSTL